MRHATFGELSEQWKTLEEPWPVAVVIGGSSQAMGHVSEVYLKIGWNLLMVQMSFAIADCVCESLNLNMIYAIPEVHI